MKRTSHGPSAKRLRQEAIRRGESLGEIARTIHDHCTVSLLRAQRLARGLTLKEAAAGLNSLGAGREDAPRVDGDQLGHWETGRQPRPATLALLCEFYGGCSPADLGFDSAAAAAPSPSSALVVVGQPLPSPTTLRESFAADSLEQQVDAARRSLDRTLAVGTVTSTQLDLLDEQVLWAREQYVYTPPAPMIKVLLNHLTEVEDLAAHRQPAAVQVRLSELTAMLATLVADALMKLGHLPRSQSWYATARNAADDSGNTELRARVRAQAAMLPFYYGPLEAAVSLSREARIICRGRPSATAAFASAAEARALAKLGDAEGAEAALRYAVAAFEQSGAGGPADSDAFGFPERRFRLYESGTLTALGRTTRARRVQEAALLLYPSKTGIDPALLHFEAALCLAHDRSTTEACQLASATFLRMAPEHRTPIVEERAREVIGALPPGAQSVRAARELREILALPPGQM
ncbi:helix-turn-helix transcriptional regulator [Streptomyces sp. NBC_01142]|uniref:helix-turn-helix domain-containing protein n=1 Tax=Streptomyces sp. NBC_01142 TaxID=2975865 RepID=UPI00224F11BF|nr:helix-turn-helix transcriptional regulator [Streptomyces sp. NBC_01142]MCX4826154.1 helix-turn-helix transcriptional regulator [Streptomyces sp. NBC_01142]